MRFNWPMAKPAGREEIFGRRKKLRLGRKRQIGELSHNRPTETHDFDRLVPTTSDVEQIEIFDSPSPKRCYQHKRIEENRRDSDCLDDGERIIESSATGKDWLMRFLPTGDVSQETSKLTLPTEHLLSLPKENNKPVASADVQSFTKVCSSCQQASPVVGKMVAQNGHMVGRLPLPDIIGLLHELDRDSNLSTITSSPCTRGETSNTSQTTQLTSLVPQQGSTLGNRNASRTDSKAVDDFLQLPAFSLQPCLPSPDLKKLTSTPLQKWVSVTWDSDGESTTRCSDVLSLLSVCSDGEEDLHFRSNSEEDLFVCSGSDDDLFVEEPCLPVLPCLQDPLVDSRSESAGSAISLEGNHQKSFVNTNVGKPSLPTHSIEKGRGKDRCVLSCPEPVPVRETRPPGDINLSTNAVEKRSVSRSLNADELKKAVFDKHRGVSSGERKQAEAKPPANNLPYGALFRRSVKRTHSVPTSNSEVGSVAKSLSKRTEVSVSTFPRRKSLKLPTTSDHVSFLDSSQRGLLLDTRADTVSVNLSCASRRALFKPQTSLTLHPPSTAVPGVPKQFDCNRAEVVSAKMSSGGQTSQPAVASSGIQACFDLIVADDDSDDDLFASAAEEAETVLLRGNSKAPCPETGTVHGQGTCIKGNHQRDSKAFAMPSSHDVQSLKAPLQLPTNRRPAQTAADSWNKSTPKPPLSVIAGVHQGDQSSFDSGSRTAGKASAACPSSTTSSRAYVRPTNRTLNSASLSASSSRPVGNSSLTQSSLSRLTQAGQSSSALQQVSTCPVCEMRFTVGTPTSQINHHIAICCGEDI